MPDRYAVIGHPIAHSKSPLIHGLFAQATQQDMTYEAIDGGADDGGFMRALAAFRAAGGLGLNVTLPFKLQALAAADQASDDARLAGAANALRFDGDRIEARNFDGIGLVRDIEVNLGVPLAGKRVLLLGAGGATRGAVLPIARAGAARIAIANRTAAKADERGNQQHEGAEAVDAEADAIRLRPDAESSLQGRPVCDQIQQIGRTNQRCVGAQQTDAALQRFARGEGCGQCGCDQRQENRRNDQKVHGLGVFLVRGRLRG